MFVPVVDLDNKPLMPTTPGRARRWVESGKATPFWKRGIWCVRLNSEPSARNVIDVVVAIDPGSKREGYTVKSSLHTYLNIQAHAVTWVKDKVETRRNLRRSRRNRNTPCREPRWANRKKNNLPPSTKSRWGWKLRVLSWLSNMFPISVVVVEDVGAESHKGKGGKWNLEFSPVQYGKNWFYDKLRELYGVVQLYKGFETAQLRSVYGLKKTTSKLAEVFIAHCVDSWVMANDYIGGHLKPDNLKMLIVEPLKKHYRQLHIQNHASGGFRKNYGSTRSMGFERGSIVSHSKYGVCLIGGTSNGRVSLHSRETNKRISRNADPKDIKFLSYNSFLVRNVVS